MPREFKFWAIGLVVSALAAGQTPLFQRTFTVGLKDPVVLDVSVANGNLVVAYSRDGQVSIYVSGSGGAWKPWSEDFFASVLNIEQSDNRISVRSAPNPNIPRNLSFRIDVPFRTELKSTISGTGNQTVVGLAGPVSVETNDGDIEVSTVRFGLVSAKTGNGNIRCSRAVQVESETAAGNITLMENGPAIAVVRKGLGRIEVGGARGKLRASTDKGELSVKAALWDDWDLHSTSGNIRIALPPRAAFEADFATQTGEIGIGRKEMDHAAAETRQYQTKVNGGGKKIRARSESGNITLE